MGRIDQAFLVTLFPEADRELVQAMDLSFRTGGALHWV